MIPRPLANGSGHALMSMGVFLRNKAVPITAAIAKGSLLTRRSPGGCARHAAEGLHGVVGDNRNGLRVHECWRPHGNKWGGLMLTARFVASCRRRQRGDRGPLPECRHDGPPWPPPPLHQGVGCERTAERSCMRRCRPNPLLEQVTGLLRLTHLFLGIATWGAGFVGAHPASWTPFLPIAIHGRPFTRLRKT